MGFSPEAVADRSVGKGPVSGSCEQSGGSSKPCENGCFSKKLFLPVASGQSIFPRMEPTATELCWSLQRACLAWEAALWVWNTENLDPCHLSCCEQLCDHS